MIFERPLMLASRFMGKNRQGNISRHIIGAVLGITISLIPLVVVLEVTNGMISGITKRYLEIGTYHLQARNYTGFSPNEESEAIGIIEKIPGIKTVFPVVTGVGLAYSKDGRTGVSLKGFSSDYWRKDIDIHNYLSIDTGEFDLTAEDSALVSSEAARILNVAPGDKFKVLTAKKLKSGKTLLKPSYFTVKGIFSTGYYELDSVSIYINIKRGSRLFSNSGSRYLGIKTEDPDRDISALAARIRSSLSSNWYVFTWYDLEKPMYESFSNTRKLLLFIMLLIVLVASVNIASALTMLVIEKEKDVAVLKSTGVSSKIIMTSYIYSGFTIGLAGTVLGIGSGLLLAVNINELIHGLEYFLNLARYIFHAAAAPFHSVPFSKVVILSSSYYLDRIPVRISFKDIMMIGISSVALSTAAAVFPAVSAGKIKPMEVFRRQ